MHVLIINVQDVLFKEIYTCLCVVFGHSENRMCLKSTVSLNGA